LHSGHDQFGSQRGIIMVNAFDAMAMGLEDAFLKLPEAVQCRVQRLFRESIEQVMESFIRIGVYRLCVFGLRGGFGAYYYADKRQCQNGELVEGAHRGAEVTCRVFRWKTAQ
jgi:hypothetical protein